MATLPKEFKILARLEQLQNNLTEAMNEINKNIRIAEQIPCRVDYISGMCNALDILERYFPELKEE
jgi:hypothetical protein